ncbi:MAG: serine hydrolase domain-containing protein [Acidobacteriota bacterium]|nr:serine hydrolase domain-containing protein [Acidobacteriota bacterium]
MSSAMKTQMRRIARQAAAPALAFLLVFTAACETKESLERKRIRNVEKGLLHAVFIKGTTPEKMDLETRMRFYRVPGLSLAVMDENALAWSRTYGYKNGENFDPVTPDTMFQAGALSRPVTAAAVLRAVDENRLALSDDIRLHLRSWRLPPGVPDLTLRGLLSQSDGLLLQVFPGYPPDGPIPSLLQILNGEHPANNLPLAEPRRPSVVEVESESGYVILQQLLADIHGESFAALIKKNVLDPLSMENSTFEIVPPPGLESRAALGHDREGRLIEGGWRIYPESAAKGLWTTPEDLIRFVARLMAAARGEPDHLLSHVSARGLFSPQSGDRSFGFMVEGSGQDIFFHLMGKTEGYACWLFVYPYRGQGAAVMTNSSNGFVLIEEIFRALSAAYDWPGFKPVEKPLYRLDPSVYTEYVGRYEVTPDYILDVTHEGYYLVIRPTGQTATKFYVESPAFFFSVDPFIRIQFVRDDAGGVKGLILWQQDFQQEARKISLPEKSVSGDEVDGLGNRLDGDVAK